MGVDRARRWAPWRRVYILLVVAAASAAAASAAVTWPGPWTATQAWQGSLIAGFALLAAALPVRVSPQAQASLLGAPLFAGVLILAPGQAAATGFFIAAAMNLRQRRRAEVVVFNTAVTSGAVAVSSLVFHGLGGSSAGLESFAPGTLGASATAALALHAANSLTVAGIVWMQKGNAFWAIWSKTWLVDIIQEGGVLSIGHIGAVLLTETWWAVLLLLGPMTLAHVALGRSVRESSRNADLTQQLEGKLRQLRATQAQLVQQEKLASIGTLAAGVAHEINNPLFCITGTAEMLLADQKRHLASETSVEFVNVIHTMAKRASGIMSGLLSYSRPAGPAGPVHLPAVMDTAMELTGSQAARSGVTVLRRYEATPPVSGVARHLEQVFVNLLMNAIDAMPAGGNILLQCRSVNGRVEALVRDDGPGIAPEHLPRLFEPFYTTKDPGKGTGLGLYICHQIVTAHQGTIEISSTPRAGTTVKIEFPALEPADHGLMYRSGEKRYAKPRGLA